MRNFIYFVVSVVGMLLTGPNSPLGSNAFACYSFMVLGWLSIGSTFFPNFNPVGEMLARRNAEVGRTNKICTDVDALVESAKELGLNDSDLSSAVLYLKLMEAVDLNKGGLRAQIEYFLESHDYDVEFVYNEYLA